MEATNPATGKFKGFIFGRSINEIQSKAREINLRASGKAFKIPNTHIKMDG
jgi:hypothetical protein